MPLECQNPDLILLQEMKLEGDESLNFIKHYKIWQGLFVEANRAFVGLGVLWHAGKIKVSLKNSNSNSMQIEVMNLNSNLVFEIHNVYGPIKMDEKKFLWDHLSNAIAKQKVVIGGDFNVIMDLKEKMGGSRKILQNQKYFLKLFEENNLVDASNGIFTGNNRRKGFTNIAERLDRFFMSENWF